MVERDLLSERRFPGSLEPDLAGVESPAARQHPHQYACARQRAQYHNLSNSGGDHGILKALREAAGATAASTPTASQVDGDRRASRRRVMNTAIDTADNTSETLFDCGPAGKAGHQSVWRRLGSGVDFARLRRRATSARGRTAGRETTPNASLLKANKR